MGVQMEKVEKQSGGEVDLEESRTLALEESDKTEEIGDKETENSIMEDKKVEERREEEKLEKKLAIVETEGITERKEQENGGQERESKDGVKDEGVKEGTER